jgi:uncharacterized protein involved in exopolysaccharide biosynthesis
MNTNNDNHQLPDEIEIDFLEWAIAIGKEKIIIFITFFMITTVAVVYSLITPPIYTARAVISTNNSQQGGASGAAALVGTLIGSTSVGPLRPQDEMYIGLLNSENLQNEVINTLKLKDKFNSNILLDLRQKLKTLVRFSSDKKSGFIIVEADDKDPEFAAKLANTYVDELRNLLGRLAIASAQQKLLFFQKAIAKTQSELSEAKSKFQEAKELSGVLSDSSQTENAYSQIASKELQISALSHFSTAMNPDMKRLEAEISALRDQLFKSEKVQQKTQTSNKVATDAYREIKSLEMILGSLTSQYKSSIAEAFSNEPFIQQIDKASSPERRSHPKRTQIVIFYATLGIIIGLMFAITKIWFLKNKESYKQLILLKNSWFNFKISNI